MKVSANRRIQRPLEFPVNSLTNQHLIHVNISAMNRYLNEMMVPAEPSYLRKIIPFLHSASEMIVVRRCPVHPLQDGYKAASTEELLTGDFAVLTANTLRHHEDIPGL